MLSLLVCREFQRAPIRLTYRQLRAVGEASLSAREWETVRPDESGPYVELLRAGVLEWFGVDLPDVDSAPAARLDAETSADVTGSVARSVCSLARTTTVLSRWDRGADE